MSCSLRGCGFGRVQKKSSFFKVRKSRKSGKSGKKKSRRIKRKSQKTRKSRRTSAKSRRTRKSRRTSVKSSPSAKFSPSPFIGDEITCPVHKKKVKVVNVLLDGGTLALSCGCKDGRWNFIKNKRSFGFKYLRNDQIINSVFHDYPANLTCDRA